MNLSQERSHMNTAAPQQSLHLLQLSLPELQEYLNEAVMENPLLELNQATPHAESAPAAPACPPQPQPEEDDEPAPEGEGPAQQETFVAHLKQQLPQISRYLPERFLPMCGFIIESLDRRGYLDESIDLLAADLGVSIDDATQALYAVQSLSPTGVGARTLEECLILQLAEGPHFNEYTLAIVQHHLEALARRDFDQIAEALSISAEQVQAYFTLIRSLSPIPSNGFVSAQDTGRYLVPEAYVEPQWDQLAVRYNEAGLAVPVVNQDYVDLIETTSDPDTRAYLTEKYQQVIQLKADMEFRQNTLIRIIRHIVNAQKEYLLGRKLVPAPLSLQEVADRLELDPAVVTRAVSDKYISVSGQPVPLKSLLWAQIGNGIPMSSTMLKLYLDKLIAAEDRANPLSDEGICTALDAMGIRISRETVAEYRSRFGIPDPEQRRS